MSTAPKRPAAEVRPIAERIVEELRPYCERIEIAGSLRRRCEYVSDIEIVCEPRTGDVTRADDGDLFASTHTLNLLDDYVSAQLAGPVDWQPRLDRNGRRACGRRYKRLLVDGVPLDLFSVIPPAQWSVILAIRTGPAEFSRRLVTQRSHGGYLPDRYRVREGVLSMRTDTGGAAVPIDTEHELFDAIGIDWIEPEERR